jgi:hypothetical protein
MHRRLMRGFGSFRRYPRWDRHELAIRSSAYFYHIRSHNMNCNLIALAVCCVISGSAFASADNPGSEPPHLALADNPGSEPPHLALADNPGSEPPHLALADNPGSEPPHLA